MKTLDQALGTRNQVMKTLDQSSGEESVRERETAPAKRGEWETQKAAETDEFTLVEARASKRLAKQGKQSKVEREQVQCEAKAKEEDRRDRLLQRQ